MGGEVDPLLPGFGCFVLEDDVQKFVAGVDVILVGSDLPPEGFGHPVGGFRAGLLLKHQQVIFQIMVEGADPFLRLLLVLVVGKLLL